MRIPIAVIFAAAALLARSVPASAQADNLPTYEEYQRRKAESERAAAEQNAPAEEAPGEAAGEPAESPDGFFIFTDEYDITHYVESFDLVPKKYRPQITGENERDDGRASPRKSPGKKKYRDVLSVGEIEVSSAGLGPDWESVPRFKVLMISDSVLIERDPGRRAFFEMLQAEYQAARALSWSLIHYNRLDRANDSKKTIEAYYLVFEDEQAAAAYLARTSEGLGSGSAGYKFRTVRGSFVGEKAFLIDIEDDAGTSRKLLAARRRNALVILSFKPDEMNDSIKLAKLIDDFMKRSMRAN